MAGIVGRGWEGRGLQVRSAVVQGLGQKETEGGRWIPAARTGEQDRGGGRVGTPPALFWF